MIEWVLLSASSAVVGFVGGHMVGRSSVQLGRRKLVVLSYIAGAWAAIVDHTDMDEDEAKKALHETVMSATDE